MLSEVCTYSCRSGINNNKFNIVLILRDKHMLPVCEHVLLLFFSTVPTAAVAPQQVIAGSTNSPSVVKQVQEQENKAMDSPSQNSKPEQQDDKDGEVKKEKKKVKKPKEKVL